MFRWQSQLSPVCLNIWLFNWSNFSLTPSCLNSSKRNSKRTLDIGNRPADKPWIKSWRATADSVIYLKAHVRKEWLPSSICFGNISNHFWWRHTAVQGKVASQKEPSTTTIPFISFSEHDPAIRVAFSAVRIFLSLHGHCNAFVSRREDMPSFVAG